MDGDLNVDAFCRSWHGLVERHTLLRSRIYRDGKVWLQDVVPAEAATLKVVDLGHTTVPDGERDVHARLRTFLAKPPPLDAGVTHVNLYRLSPTVHVVAGFVHHSAMDAQALRLMHREVGQGYFSALGGEGAPSSPRRPLFQFSDFAAWENSWLTEEAREGALVRWSGDLAEAQPLRLPWRRGHDDQPDTPQLAAFELPAPVHDLVVRVARKHGVTVNMLFLTVVSLVLGRASGMRQAMFASYVPVRRPGLETVMGCFSQMRPFHVSFEDDPSFADLLMRARKAFANTIDIRRPVSSEFMRLRGIGNVVVNFQGDTPASSAMQEGEAGRGAFRAPEPAVWINGEIDVAGLGKAAPGRDIKAYTPQLPQPLVDEFCRDLHIVARRSDTGLAAQVTYGAQRMTRDQASNLCGDLSLLHAVACSAPHQRVSELLDVIQRDA